MTTKRMSALDLRDLRELLKLRAEAHCREKWDAGAELVRDPEVGHEPMLATFRTSERVCTLVLMMRLTTGQAAPAVGREPATPSATVLETFRPFDRIEQDRMRDDVPSCMNGSVRVRRYRITVEPVEESPEVVQQRLQKLWEEETNHHQRIPLLREAAQLGYKLKGDMGTKGKMT